MENVILLANVSGSIYVIPHPLTYFIIYKTFASRSERLKTQVQSRSVALISWAGSGWSRTCGSVSGEANACLERGHREPPSTNAKWRSCPAGCQVCAIDKWWLCSRGRSAPQKEIHFPFPESDAVVSELRCKLYLHIFWLLFFCFSLCDPENN